MHSEDKQRGRQDGRGAARVPGEGGCKPGTQHKPRGAWGGEPTASPEAEMQRLQRQERNGSSHIPWREGTASSGTSPKSNDGATFPQTPAREHGRVNRSRRGLQTTRRQNEQAFHRGCWENRTQLHTDAVRPSLNTVNEKQLTVDQRPRAGGKIVKSALHKAGPDNDLPRVTPTAQATNGKTGQHEN